MESKSDITAPLTLRSGKYILNTKSDFGTASPQNITDLLIDSRSLLYPSTTLFFALQTKRDDGHRYIPGLYAAGVRAFVVSQDFDLRADSRKPISILSTARPQPCVPSPPQSATACTCRLWPSQVREARQLSKNGFTGCYHHRCGCRAAPAAIIQA